MTEKDRVYLLKKRAMAPSQMPKTKSTMPASSGLTRVPEVGTTAHQWEQLEGRRGGGEVIDWSR